MYNYKVIGRYHEAFKETFDGLTYLDCVDSSGESWYVYADDIPNHVKGTHFMIDANNKIVCVSDDPNTLFPAGHTLIALEEKVEIDLLSEFDYFWSFSGEITKVPVVTPFSKQEAMDKANMMIGIYEDLNEVHAEANWRNYRLEVFKWTEGQDVPVEPEV